MTLIRSRILCLAPLALAAKPAHAGDAMPPASPTPAPVSETLTNDWFGAGSTLREHGINLTGSLAQFYQGLAVGEGTSDWEHGGKADLFLRLDGGKLGLWEGFGVQCARRVELRPRGLVSRRHLCAE